MSAMRRTADSIMNCLCNLFDNECLWIIIIAILLINSFGNGNCARTYSGGDGCGCGCGCRG